MVVCVSRYIHKQPTSFKTIWFQYSICGKTKGEGGQQCIFLFLTIFDYFFLGVNTNLGDWEAPEGRGWGWWWGGGFKAQPPTNRVLFGSKLPCIYIRCTWCLYCRRNEALLQDKCNCSEPDDRVSEVQEIKHGSVDLPLREGSLQRIPASDRSHHNSTVRRPDSDRLPYNFS